MNKFWKNFLYIFLTLLVVFVVTYLIGSFKSVFNSYRVDETNYVNVYYVCSENKYIYFVESYEAYYVNKNKNIVCDVSYEDKFIILENESTEFSYKLFVFNKKQIFSIDDNCYFDRLESLDEK